jgi:hypothetical protein
MCDSRRYWGTQYSHTILGLIPGGTTASFPTNFFGSSPTKHHCTTATFSPTWSVQQPWLGGTVFNWEGVGWGGIYLSNVVVGWTHRKAQGKLSLCIPQRCIHGAEVHLKPLFRQKQEVNFILQLLQPQVLTEQGAWWAPENRNISCQVSQGLSGYQARWRVADSQGPAPVAGLSLNK